MLIKNVVLGSSLSRSTHDTVVIALNERMAGLRCLNMAFSSGVKTLAGSLGKDEE